MHLLCDESHSFCFIIVSSGSHCVVIYLADKKLLLYPISNMSLMSSLCYDQILHAIRNNHSRLLTATCSLLHAHCYLLTATCSLLPATCSLLTATCSLLTHATLLLYCMHGRYYRHNSFLSDGHIEHNYIL